MRLKNRTTYFACLFTKNKCEQVLLVVCNDVAASSVVPLVVGSNLQVDEEFYQIGTGFNSPKQPATKLNKTKIKNNKVINL